MVAVACLGGGGVLCVLCVLCRSERFCPSYWRPIAVLLNSHRNNVALAGRTDRTPRRTPEMPHTLHRTVGQVGHPANQAGSLSATGFSGISSIEISTGHQHPLATSFVGMHHIGGGQLLQ